MRVVVGGWNLCLGLCGVEWVVGVGVYGMVSSHFLAFFGGFCVDMGGEGWWWVWLLVVVDGLLRVVSILGGEAGGVVSLGAGWVCFLWYEWVRGTC